jgi:Ca2+:H+ antiporter
VLLRTPVRGRRHRADGRVAALSGLTRNERAGLAVVALLTVLAGAARYVGGVPHAVAFVIAGLALGGGAWIVSFSTEQVGARFSVGVTGILQSTLGNLPEFFVVLFALMDHQLIVAQTALLGSILVNALFVLGLVIIVGAGRERDGVMRFSPRLPNDTATLLLVASLIILLVGIVANAHDPAAAHVKAISIVSAIALLVVYGFWLRQYLRAEHPEDAAGEPPRLSTRGSLGLLVVSGAASGFVSDWFVHALEPTIHSAGISQAFAGLVIVAIAGNAVEHAVGIVLAAKGRSELAIAVVKNSVGQVAAFLFPLLVLVSLLTATTLTFSLAPVFVGALFATAVIVWQITGDGEATQFEGIALCAAFVVLAVVAAYQ